jgi:hypothetical protein
MENNGFFGGAFGSSGSSGGGGGDTIYTANSSLTGNRDVNLDTNILTFKNGTSSLLEANSNGTLKFKNKLLISEFVGGVGDWANNVGFGHSALASTFNDDHAMIINQAGSVGINCPTGQRINFDQDNTVVFSLTPNGQFVYGSESVLGTEKVSLQGSTLIKGIGTSTGSTLALYNNDTTPVKTWDFLDNGNVNLGVDSVLNIGSNDLDINGSGLFSISNGTKSISTTWNTHTIINLNNGNGTTYSLYSGNTSTTFDSGQFGIGVGSNIPFRIFNGSSVALGNVGKGSLDTNYNVQTSGATLIGGNLDTKLGTNEISLDHTNYPKLKISNGTTEYWLIEGDGTGSTFDTGDLYFYDNTNSRKLLQFKANGTINAPNLPTASTGLSSGDLWNNNGEVRIGTSTPTPVSSIYTADGTLTGNRTVDLNGKNLTFQKLSSTTEYTKIYRNGGLEIRGSGFDTGNDVFKVKYNASGNDLLAIGQNGGVTIDSSISMGQFNSTWNYGQQFSDGYIKFYHGATWNDNEAIRFDLRNNTSATLTFNRNGQGTSGNRFIVRSSGLAETNYGTSKEQISLQGNTLIKGDTGSERTSYNFKVANSSLEPSFMVFNNKDVIIGASTKISTEKISLQGSTLIKGDGTSTGSTLALYNSDTTPVKTWDFLDNGNVNLGVDSVVSLGDNKLTFNYDVDTATEVAPINFEFGGGFGGYYSRWNDDGGLVIKSSSTLALRVVNKVDANASMFHVGKEGGGFMSTNGSRVWTISDESTNTTKNEFNNNRISQYFSGTEYHRIQVGGSGTGVQFFKSGISGSLGQFIVGASALIGAEKISLQDNTLIDGTLDMNNNRILNAVVNPSVQETTSTATFTINSDQQTDAVLTAMAVATTIASPTGTPVQSQNLIFRFKDDGTARAITWNAIFRAIGITLPTTTTANKLLYVGCKYNSTDTKWDVVSVQEEA